LAKKNLTFHGIDKIRLFEELKAVVDKSVIKMNKLWFYGPSNSGKS
jgi:hypothetical protein